MGVETIALVTALASGGAQVYSSKQQRKAQKSQIRAQNARMEAEKAAIAEAEAKQREKTLAEETQAAKEKKMRAIGGYTGLASGGRNLLRRQARRGFLGGQAGGRFGV